MKLVLPTFDCILGVCVGLSLIGCGDDDEAPNADTSGADDGGTAQAQTTDTGSDAAADSNDDANDDDDTTAGPGADATGADTDGEDTDGQTTGEAEDLDMNPEDFACLLDWPRVRRFRITNLLGYQAETMAVAENPEGGVYPVGTVIQLIPNEAMVKRAQGWSEETNDWEFFSLATSAAGTEIEARGTTDTINAFGGNCFDCHAKAAPQWDLVCEQDHGCDPIPIPEATINMLQDNDPRCR